MKRLVTILLSLCIALGTSAYIYAFTLVIGSATIQVENPTGTPALPAGPYAIARMSGYNFRITYTYNDAALAGGTGSPNGMAVALTIPNDFPAPSVTPTNQGAINISGASGAVLTSATPTISGRTVIAYFSALPTGGQVVFNYGNGNLTIPDKTGRYNFVVSIKPVNSTSGYPTGYETVVPSPYVDVITAPGVGTAEVQNPMGTPASAIAKQSGYNIHFTYTNSDVALTGAGAPNGSAVALVIPNNFTAPSLTPGTPGYITISTLNGAVLAATTPSIINGRTVLAYFTALPTNGQIIFDYGNGNLVMPDVAQKYNFDMYLKPQDTTLPYPNGFQPVVPSPQVTVQSAISGSSGSFSTVVENPIGTPANAIARQTGYNLRFTYTYTGMSITGGTSAPNGMGVAITIPNDFPVPSLNPTDQGAVSISAAMGAVLASPTATIVNGRTVIAFFTALPNGGQIIFNYGNGNLKMPDRPNRYTFNMALKPQNTTSGYPSGFQTLMPSPQVNVLTNMTPATLIFKPDTASTSTELEISFQLGAGEQRSLFKGDRIKVWFDWDPILNQTINSPIAYPNNGYLGLNVPLNLRKESVKINGMTCTVGPQVTYQSSGAGAATALVDFFVPNDIRCSTTTGQVVRINIDKAAGLIQGNGDLSIVPAAPFTRRARIATLNASTSMWIEPDQFLFPNPVRMYPNVTNDLLDSNIYEIKTRINTITPSPPLVTVTPTTVDQEAQYVIGASACGVYGSFQVGSNGSLIENVDTITFEFPQGTKIPTSISPASILVTAFPPGTLPTALNSPPQIQGNRITIKVPFTVNANQCLTVTFTTSAHIFNPSVGANDYYIKMWTSKEPTVVNTLNYSIENPGWAVVNVDPNISFTNQLNLGECYKYSNADLDRTGARYTIQFPLSSSCSLIANTTPIVITFDSAYNGILPASFNGVAPNPAPSSVLVNGTPCTNVTILGTAITITSPINLQNGSQVTVTFLPSAQIQNPDITAEQESFILTIDVGGLCQPLIQSNSYFIKTEVSNVQVLDTSIEFPGVSFVPSTNAITPWLIHFCSGDYGDVGMGIPNLVSGDTITITFPEGTAMPSYIENGAVQLAVGTPQNAPSVILNLINPKIEGTSVTLTIPPPNITITENNNFTLYFRDTIGIKTPSTPGVYYVYVKTSRETTPVASSYFTVGTVVSKNSVMIDPNTSRSIDSSCAPNFSEYTVRFTLGQSGMLVPGVDNINIIFPLGFTGFPAVPGTLPANSVILNGILVPTVNVIAPIAPNTGTQLSIPVQDYLAPGSLVEVIVLKSAGIQNPQITTTPSFYTFKLSTTRERAWVQSNAFEIISKICMNCTTPNSSVHFAGDGTLTTNTIMMGTVDGWLIGFYPGDLGTFVDNETTVTIEFPQGTGVPAIIPKEYVRCFSDLTPLSIPGGTCTSGNMAYRVTVSGLKVTVQFPNVGGAPSPTNAAYIYFCREANLTAPMMPGNYTIKAWTSKEPTPVESCNFTVMARGMTPATVIPVPSTAGAPNVEYTVDFNLGPFGGLSKGDTINIDFGWYGGNPNYLTSIAAPGFSGNLIPPMYVVVNGKECDLPVSYDSRTPGLPAQGIIFHVQTPVAVPPGGNIRIVFKPECRISNPLQGSPFENYALDPSDPNYFVTITTNREVRPTESQEYEITRPDAPTRPIVHNDPCVAGLPSVYTVSFITPVPLTFNAATPATASWVEIKFPEGFYLPSSMLPGQVKINNYQCVVAPIVNNYTVTLAVPTSVTAWGKVTVTFDPSLMLYNPNSPGIYKVEARVEGAAQFISGEFRVCEQINICRVDISPSGSITVPIGGTQQFMAKVFDCNGALMNNDLEVNWTFSSPAGYISPIRGISTTFTAFQKGTGVLMVTATYGNRTMTSTVNITVTGKPASVIINPIGPTTLIKNQCYTYSAQLYDDNNPPNPIYSGVTYTWELTTNLGSVTPNNAKIVSFCPTADGQGGIVCKATYEGEALTARSDFLIKSGIWTLAPIPTSDLGTMRIGQLTPEIMFELRNDLNQAITAPDTITVNVECTSPTGKFSKDKLHWTDSNKIALSIVKGFSKSEPVYFSDSSPGNVTITANATNINPTFVKVSFQGTLARLLFVNESRVVSAGAPSGALTLSIRDEMGQPSPPSSDTMIVLSSYKVTDGNVAPTQSATGTFSISDTTWSPLPGNTITMRSGQQTIDVFYKDSNIGAYLIKATSIFYGTAAQQIVVTNAGSVGGNLLVNVEPPTAKIPAKYMISFRVGSGGALGANSGHIYLQFPQGTDFPTLSQAEVKVNNNPCQVLPLIDRTKNIIDIVTPVPIGANSDVNIEVPRVVNPMEGTYTLKIWTSSETQPTNSVPYIIGVSTVQRLRVTVTPNSVGLPATYMIEFKTGLNGTIGIDDQITMQFPVGTVLPASMEGRFVSVNGVNCVKSPLINGLQMTVFNPMPIQADQDVTLVIDAKGNIKNPPIPKTDYILKLSTKADAKFVDSAPYEIKQASTVSNVKVQVVPPTVSEKAKYVVMFSIGANGSLLPGDEIYIQMNDQTLPTSIAALYVTVNGINPTQDVLVDGKRIKIKVPTGIAAGQQVTVSLEASAGIKNPGNPGTDYRLSVFTSKEPYPVNSDPFTIESSIVVEHSIDPPAPNGERGWYTVAPTVTLKMNGTGMITYRFEGDPATTENPYTLPFKIQKTGQVVIYYKGKSSSGVVSAEKTIVIKYDPEAPVIKIVQPAENGTECVKVKDGGITIIGQVTDINDVEFSINGQVVPVRNGSFSMTVQLAPGQNVYTMVAKDFAGNQSTKRFCIELKNKPPVVVFDEPSFMARVTAIEFPEISPNVHQLRMKLRIKGTTEPGISQITITPLTVPGNIQSVKVNPDGRFDQELVFDVVAGVNELNAELSDSLGNKATQKLMPVLAVDFKLQSGNTTSDLNGIPVTLQSAPYINQGRTMIPFRIMAESMGAKVGYETNPTTKAVTLVTFELGSTKIVLYIGKNTATVTVAGQSRTVKLDAPPVIKNGVTMVPFRFVAENFGAKVSWDGATKTARMVYP